MRVVVITNLYPSPVHPGRAPFNRQQVRALADLCPVSVVAPVAWTEELLACWRGGSRLPPDRRVVCDGVTVEHPRYLYPPKVLRSWYGHFFRHSVRPAFERCLREFRPDLVFAPWAYPDGWAAVELGHQAGLPVVIKVHGSDILLLPRYPGRHRRTVEALRRADGVVAVSRDLAERVAGYGVEAGRTWVVYDGVDSSLFHPGPPAEARARLGLDSAGPILLFVGNLVPIKGPDLLVEACALLAQSQTRFICYLVGQGPLQPRLERQIAACGLCDRVRLVGPLAHGRLPDWYRAAAVVALPSHSEGIPCVLREAAACGTPFVASRVGGVPEIADLAESRLVPAGDATALAQALAPFLAGPTRRTGPGVARSRSHADAATELLSRFEQILHRDEGQVAQPAGADDRLGNLPLVPAASLGK
jgi:glycosyltransferase involved in cell wall biosynthesis